MKTIAEHMAEQSRAHSEWLKDMAAYGPHYERLTGLVQAHLPEGVQATTWHPSTYDQAIEIDLGPQHTFRHFEPLIEALEAGGWEVKATKDQADYIKRRTYTLSRVREEIQPQHISLKLDLHGEAACTVEEVVTLETIPAEEAKPERVVEKKSFRLVCPELEPLGEPKESPELDPRDARGEPERVEALQGDPHHDAGLEHDSDSIKRKV